MAKTTQVLLTDDLDGSPATETVLFGLAGTTYEIDLNAKNAAALRMAVERYVTAARRLRHSSVRGRSAGPTHLVDPKAVRAWAGSHKIDVPARGRIPASVLEQYRAAGN